ncbi:MAG: efflux RND transporter periplasmic adaptor subunit, partial [Bacteroidota bacterium]
MATRNTSNIKKYGGFVATFAVGFLLSWLAFGGGGSGDGEGHMAHHEAGAEVWTCSMDPQVRQDGPGKCPICGMDLTPMAVDESASSHLGPPRLEMSPSALQMARVQTSKISSGGTSAILEVDGHIAADAGRTRSLTAHFPGRIERLNVRYEGQSLRKNQILATIYSPELVATQEELREAAKPESAVPGLREAARKKLRRWKIPESIIQQVEDSGKVWTEMPLRADFGGVVITKKVMDGDHLKEGQALVEVADLSRIWVEFEVHERDLGRVRVGDRVQFNLPAYPETSFDGRIDFVNPVVNGQSR